MNGDERRDEILKYVNAKGDVSFSELKRILPNVSDMTIRRESFSAREIRLSGYSAGSNPLTVWLVPPRPAMPSGALPMQRQRR